MAAYVRPMRQWLREDDGHALKTECRMIDLLICLAVGIGLYVGYSCGVVRQIGSIVAILAAVVVCHLLGGAASSLVAGMMGGVRPEDSFPTEIVATVVGHVGLFLIVWWGFGLAVRSINDLVRAIHLGVLNSLAGAVMMAFKVVLVASILLNLWLATNPGDKMLASAGPIAKTTVGIGPALMGYVEDNF